MTSEEFSRVEREPQRLLADIYLAAMNLHAGLVNLQRSGKVDISKDPVSSKLLVLTEVYLKDNGGTDG